MSIEKSMRLDVKSIQKTQFPTASQKLHLNCAALALLPQRTKTIIQEHTELLADDEMRYWETIGSRLWQEFPEVVMHHIGAQEIEEIVPMSSVSMAINLIANTLPWQAGDEIVLCDIEFPSNAYPWMAQAGQGVVIRHVPPQMGTLTVEALDAVVTDRTRLVSVSSVQFFTGGRANLQALGDYCYSKKILFVVDAIQSIGHSPINVENMHIDVLVSGAQKSMLALQGGGFMYIRRELAESLQPTSIGCNATENWLHWMNYDMTPGPGAWRFNQGTTSSLGMASVVASLNYIQELGISAIESHTTSLAQRFIDDVQAYGFELLTPATSENHAHIITFGIHQPNEVTTHIHTELTKKGVYISKHLNREGSAYLRVAVHCYNSDDDRIQFFDFLNGLIKEYSV